MVSPLAGFDQVIAISQQHINQSLERRWKLNSILSKFETLMDDDDGKMVGKMNPPTVELFVGGEPHKARFFLNFQTGSFDFFAKLDGDEKKQQHTLSMDGWKLAFMANLSPQKLGSVPSEIQSLISPEIRDKILIAGSYSLSQIIIDLTTSDIIDFDLARSVTPGLSLTPGDDIRQKTALKNFLTEYIETLVKGSHNVLGYAITVADPTTVNKYSPSFPPVSVQPQTMRYPVDPQSPNKFDGQNAFLFLEMAGDMTGRTAPVNPLGGELALIPPGQAAVMLIARNSIWNGFFVPKLAFLNREALLFVNRVGHWVHSEGKSTPEQEAVWNLTKEGMPTTTGWSAISDNKAEFKWADGRKDVHDDTGFGYNLHDRYETGSTVELSITLDSGTSNITMHHHITYHHKHNHFGTHGSSMIDETRTEGASVAWDAVISLASVADGVLGYTVTVNNLNCEVKNKTHTSGPFNFIFGGETVHTQLQERIKKLLADNFQNSDFGTQIANELKTQSQFVFPGGGTFFMKSPEFTGDGDLRVWLSYKQSSEGQTPQPPT